MNNIQWQASLYKKLNIQQYRNDIYPLYAWADHIYVALTFISLIIGIAFALIGNPNYGWFFLLFAIALIGGAIHGKYELEWIESWMRKNPTEVEQLDFYDAIIKGGL